MPKKNDGEIQTQHGDWTPETSEAADREIERLKDENPFSPTPATESRDKKTHLNVPKEHQDREQ
jgi:hypothetical protein